MYSRKDDAEVQEIKYLGAEWEEMMKLNDPQRWLSQQRVAGSFDVGRGATGMDANRM